MRTYTLTLSDPQLGVLSQALTGMIRPVTDLIGAINEQIEAQQAAPPGEPPPGDDEALPGEGEAR